MSHTMRTACAVADTVRPGIDADAEVGPHVDGETVVHIQTGSPTSPVLPDGGAIPIAGPSSRIVSSARCANVAGDTDGPNPSGGFGSQTQPPPVAPPPRQVA